MSITRHIQSVLRDNPGRSWNDLVHSTLLQRLSATTGTVSDLWMRWLNSRGYPYSSLSDMLQAYWNRLNVPTEDRNYFTLGWFELFSTPLPLFSNGEQGAWYDPSDMSTLFQDDAGTVPVTADGQPVGRMLDKSGRGNHVSQATATARPVFRDSGGLRWLEFDGVDDFLASATGGGFTSQEAIAAVMPTGGEGTSRDWLNDGSSTRYGRSTANLYFTVQPGATTATVASPGINVAVVHGGRSSETQSISRVNGVDGSPISVTSPIAPPTGFAVGAAEGGVAQRWNGRIYGIVWRQGVFTPSERAGVERYLARLAGVVL